MTAAHPSCAQTPATLCLPSHLHAESVPKYPFRLWRFIKEEGYSHLQASHILAPFILHLTMIANGPFS